MRVCNPILSHGVNAGPTLGLIPGIHLQRHCQSARRPSSSKRRETEEEGIDVKGKRVQSPGGGVFTARSRGHPWKSVPIAGGVCTHTHTPHGLEETRGHLREEWQDRSSGRRELAESVQERRERQQHVLQRVCVVLGPPRSTESRAGRQRSERGNRIKRRCAVESPSARRSALPGECDRETVG